MKRILVSKTRAEFLAVRLVTLGVPFSFLPWGFGHYIDVAVSELPKVRMVLSEAGWQLDASAIMDPWECSQASEVRA